MIRYSNDPRWIKARFEGFCHCGKAIKRGELILYFPNGRRALCEACGQPAYNRFLGEVQDEAMMNGPFL
jgi:hypothetical protein